MIKTTSKLYKVTKLKHTTAALWKDLETGDLVRFEVNVKHIGRASRGSYAPTVTIIDVKRGVEHHTTFDMLYRTVDYAIKLEEYDTLEG